MTNKDAWDKFMVFITDARSTMEDNWAPVALICLQASTGDDGLVELKPWNDVAGIWPASFPVAERGPLLKRIAKPYEDGTVLRSHR